MAEQQEHLYFVAREQVSRALAATARDPHISIIHLQLADAYACKAQSTEPPPDQYLIEPS